MCNTNITLIVLKSPNSHFCLLYTLLGLDGVKVSTSLTYIWYLGGLSCRGDRNVFMVRCCLSFDGEELMIAG